MQGWKLFLAPLMWRFFEQTTRLDTFPQGKRSVPGPVIYASLHRDLLPAIMYLKPTKLAIIISNSPDGDILVHTLGKGNYNFVRGASGQGGGRAFIGMRKMLEAGVSVGVAVDGPEGPFGTIHDGALHMARITGLPIVPIKAEPSHALILKTWDRTVVPLPFTRVKIVCGDPLFIPPVSEDIVLHRNILKDFFKVGEDQP